MGIEDFKKDAANMVAIDCSQNKSADSSYKQHRVKGALWLGADWSVAKAPTEIKVTMDGLGVGSDDVVVLYD